jgi:CheY-like chemotaxis protein
LLHRFDEYAVRRLLYIEDNQDNLYMLQLRLDVLGGYEILSATDGPPGSRWRPPCSPI